MFPFCSQEQSLNDWESPPSHGQYRIPRDRIQAGGQAKESTTSGKRIDATAPQHQHKQNLGTAALGRHPRAVPGSPVDPASWIPSSFPLPSSYETATTTATATATITATGHIDRGRCAARAWWAVRYRAASGSASPCFVHTDPSSERVGAGPGWLMSPADGDHRTFNHITLHPFRGVF
jgi:hypothetical protein